MRRKAGIAAINSRKEEAVKFSAVGKELEETKITFVRDVLDNFKSSLVEFATKHRSRINSDPEFRLQFHKMCNSVGVDPLSSSKGFWADVLGIGNFYFKLGVLIIQTCLILRPVNGGIMPIEKLLHHIQSNPAYKATSLDDVNKAIQKLESLGNGFRLINVGDKVMVLSVPVELNKDNEEILEVVYSYSDDVDDTLFVSADSMKTIRGWTTERFNLAIQPMLHEGIVWLDTFKGEDRYYFPNFRNSFA